MLQLTAAPAKQRCWRCCHLGVVTLNVTCHCSCRLHIHGSVSQYVSERCSLVMSQISFAVAHDLLITASFKVTLSNGLLAEHV
jgi:hypothetical protein